jgi:CTP synthase
MEKKEVKYIVVTGGVLSGLGKGLFISSLGKILQSQGYNVMPIKIDPYVNIDAGTMNPIEHGEVYVLEDGSEVDMDLGTYERFLNLTLSTQSNITTGKIFKYVIEKERRGDYLGKTVQLIPFVTNELKLWYRNVAKNSAADIVLIEIGGTVGDIENQIFLESVRELSMEENVFFVHCTLVPVMGVVGEQKTKPTQQSIRMLREIGIIPHMIFCRSENLLNEGIIKKISLFCGVKPEYVISGPDLKNIYQIPLILEDQNVAEKILTNLGLEPKKSDLDEWKKFVEKANNAENKIRIAITGKYTALKDSYASVFEAISHASGNNNCKAEVIWVETTDIEEGKLKVEDALLNVDGIVVPGGFGSRGTEGKIECIKYAREKNLPFLGLCYGMQLAVIEYARNKCNLKNAHSTEINPETEDPIIDIMPDQRSIEKKGGTMRLGVYPALIRDDSKVHDLYEKDVVLERHRHRYEVNPSYHKVLQDNGLLLSGVSPDGKLAEFIELPEHKFFIATQAHPEFTSRPLKPNPLFDGFIKACLYR